jgi:ribose/xylose/arabinose/galactoside ABC-type transport system permease subunit
MLNNSAVSTKDPKSISSRIGAILSNNFVWVLVVVVSFIAFLIAPVFYSMNNLYNLLVTFSVLGLLTLAEAIVLLTGNFDNSIEFTLIFSAMVAAWLTVDHTYASGLQLSATVGIIGTLAVGVGIGVVNGVLVGYVGMQPFITTFASGVVVTGLGILMTGGSILMPFPEGFTTLGRGLIGPLPLAGLFVIGVYVIFHLILRYTHLGRRLFVVGGSIEAARSLGVNEKKTQMIAFILAGLLAAIGGWILGGRLNSASGQMSSGQLLLAYGAAVIGGVRLGGGEAKVSGIFGGVILIASIYTLMNLAQVDPYIITATAGTVILGAMLLDAIRSGEFLRARN